MYTPQGDVPFAARAIIPDSVGLGTRENEIKIGTGPDITTPLRGTRRGERVDRVRKEAAATWTRHPNPNLDTSPLIGPVLGSQTRRSRRILRPTMEDKEALVHIPRDVRDAAANASEFLTRMSFRERAWPQEAPNRRGIHPQEEPQFRPRDFNPQGTDERGRAPTYVTAPRFIEEDEYDRIEVLTKRRIPNEELMGLDRQRPLSYSNPYDGVEPRPIDSNGLLPQRIVTRIDREVLVPGGVGEGAERRPQGNSWESRHSRFNSRVVEPLRVGRVEMDVRGAGTQEAFTLRRESVRSASAAVVRTNPQVRETQEGLATANPRVPSLGRYQSGRGTLTFQFGSVRTDSSEGVDPTLELSRRPPDPLYDAESALAANINV